MTVKQLLEKTGVSVSIVDGPHKYQVSVWGLLYDAFGDCVVNDIQVSADGDGLEITLKTQLVRE
mgnify:CR=1 FL=1